ncbi:hypothetical protein HDV02_003594 [Globomyces sp. JEL0801]|nr:hypothetical protein HDV02_003594 [Globomyces sp. JEL0801]
MSKTVAETETVFDIMKGADENDPTSVKFVDLPKPITTENNLEGIKIGIPSEYYVEGISDEVLESWNLAIHHLESKGATIVPVSLPSTQFALSAYYIISPAEAYSNLAKYDGIRYGHRSDLKKIENTRAEGFGNEVKRRLMIGAFVLKSSTNVYYKKAQQMRAKVQRDFDETFISINPLTNFQPRNPKVNLLLTPASMTSAPTLDDVKLNKCNPYVNDVFTIPASLAGLPAIVVPCKRDAGELPIGLQLIGQYGDDSLVLKVAKSLESSS